MFSQDIPIVVIFKGFGIQSDQEIAELVGYEEDIVECLSASLEDCHRLQIFTQIQVTFFRLDFQHLSASISFSFSFKGVETHCSENENRIETIRIESTNTSKSN